MAFSIHDHRFRRCLPSIPLQKKTLGLKGEMDRIRIEMEENKVEVLRNATHPTPLL